MTRHSNSISWSPVAFEVLIFTHHYVETSGSDSLGWMAARFSTSWSSTVSQCLDLIIISL